MAAERTGLAGRAAVVSGCPVVIDGVGMADVGAVDVDTDEPVELATAVSAGPGPLPDVQAASVRTTGRASTPLTGRRRGGMGARL
ncbi:hypothetical protein GCM10028802_07080 [Terrabacter terrigena]